MTKDTTTDKGSATIKYVGLDVHKDTIAVAVADDGKPDGLVLGIYPNDEARLRSVLSKIGPLVVSEALRQRQREIPAPACAIAWNAQQRLNKRYRHLLARGKTSHQTVVAVGRELLGFIWAIATTVKSIPQNIPTAA